MTAYHDRMLAGEYAPPADETTAEPEPPEPAPLELEESEQEKEDLAALTVEQLRSRLGGQGLPTGGTKTELVARLEQAE